MHKGVILLVEATDVEDAEYKLSDFMEAYGNGDVWDWYRIGGRWNNGLSPKDKMEQFDKWVKEEYKSAFKTLGYDIKDIENPEVRPVIQAKWESLGLKGQNPYYSGYAFDLNEEEEKEVNIVPLSDCIETVKDWCINVEEKCDELFQELVLCREEEKEKGGGLRSAYIAKKYSDIRYGDFSFQSNVYNITTGEGECVPDDSTDYYAIIVDMHN